MDFLMSRFARTRVSAATVGVSLLALFVGAGGAFAGDFSLSADSFASYEEAVPGVAPPGAGETATYLDAQGQEISPDTAPEGDAEAAAIGCTPESGRDNPHRSSTGVAVSGHGWWNKGNCSNDRANVFNCIYEWYTDNTWRRKDCSVTKELRPRRAGGGRTTARRECANTAVTSWRNHVDVDVIGEIDTAENPMRQNDVACRVF
jgi:hypothetical protein